jgi:hypothetical protein
MGKAFWNGRDKTPVPGQQIYIYSIGNGCGSGIVEATEKDGLRKFEKHLKLKQEAWDRVSATFRGYDDWHLDKVPTEDGLTETVSNEEDFSIAVEFPGEEEIGLMRIPKGNEWAFFDTFVSVKLSEDKSIAGFDDGVEVIPWQDQSQVPRPGQRVRIFWVKEEVKEEKLEAREEKKKEFTQAIISRPKPADAHPEEAGGKSVPMQQMHEREQQPLSPKSEPQQSTESTDVTMQKDTEETERPKEINTPMSVVPPLLDAAQPIFEVPPLLQAVPTQSIKAPPLELKVLQQQRKIDKELEDDKFFIGPEWKDDFTWDLVSRKVESTRGRILRFSIKPWMKSRVWREVLQTNWGGILREKYGEEIEAHIRLSHQQEWDRWVRQKLSSTRRCNRNADIELALLIYYNEDIETEERARRWEMLRWEIVEPYLKACISLDQAPKPLTWHFGDNPRLSRRMWRSIDENRDKAWEVLDDFPERHAQRIKDEAPGYWKARREEWRSKFEQALLAFKKKNETLGQHTTMELRK